MSKTHKKTREEILAAKRKASKLRYEKIKSDPELSQIRKEKDKESYSKKKKNRPVTDITMKSVIEQQKQREKWRQHSNAYYLRKKKQKEIQSVSEQEVQPGPSKALDTSTSSDSNASREQDPLSRVIEQCRFCGEFSKDCVAVSDNMPYLASNKTTLVLNDSSVQLDFNNHSLPKTVCRDCDAKLQEIADFVKVVKTAQDTLINVSEERPEFAETRVEFEVVKAEEAVDTETETLVIKTEYDSQQESEDENEDKEGIVDSLTVGETVFVKKTATHKRKSDTSESATAKPKKLKSKKCEVNELIIDIKEEVIEKEGQGQSEVSADVNPSELELATSALAFEMAGDGTS